MNDYRPLLLMFAVLIVMSIYCCLQTIAPTPKKIIPLDGGRERAERIREAR
ncbi:hypothetical protein [Suttonella ornithocola]|uniref:Uncharacterized protein n=1 Tax=Suttonella ornithocola TaxID=279832 RepID=A0A380MSF4_9GAMM|nr:hypothetical protein [Suttonella ornithocola]SUO95232.1 Uncharacterised protein [Suttonella ornithocola]